MPKVSKKAGNAKNAGSAKKGAAASKGKAPAQQPKKDPRFVARPRPTSVAALQPKRDMTRFVRWPRYIKLQRQKRVLLKRLHVPPSLNQFNMTLDKEWAMKMIKFFSQYKPESAAEKKVRLEKRAEALAKLEKGQSLPPTPKPHTIKYGINHVTSLIEKKEAKLVLIAHDVDPIEIVVWLPALCRKKGVPYAIIKSKSRLGRLVGLKTTSVVALTTVKSEHQADLQKLAEGVSEMFNARYDAQRRQWGGLILGRRSRQAVAKKERAARSSILK